MNYQIKIFGLLLVLISAQVVLSQEQADLRQFAKEQETKKRRAEDVITDSKEVVTTKADTMFPDRVHMPTALRKIILGYVGITIIRSFDHTHLAQQVGRPIAAMDSIIHKGDHVISIVGPDEVTRTFDAASGKLLSCIDNNDQLSRSKKSKTQAITLYSKESNPRTKCQNDLIVIVGLSDEKEGNLAIVSVTRKKPFVSRVFTASPITTCVAIHPYSYAHLVKDGFVCTAGLADGSLKHEWLTPSRYGNFIVPTDFGAEVHATKYLHKVTQEHTKQVKHVAFTTNSHNELLRGSLGDDGILWISNADRGSKVEVPGFKHIENFTFTTRPVDGVCVVGIGDGDKRVMKILTGPDYSVLVNIRGPFSFPISFIKNERNNYPVACTSGGLVKRVCFDKKQGESYHDPIEGCTLSCDLDKIRIGVDKYGKKRIITADANKVDVWGEWSDADIATLSDPSKNIVMVEPKPQESCVIM